MLLVQNRKGDFHAPVKVTLHPVGGSEKNVGLTVVMKEKYARVLEITVDDRDDANPLRQARHARSETAHTPDDQIDLDARPVGKDRAPR